MSDADELKEQAAAYAVDPMKAEIDALAEQIYREKVIRARQMPIEDKIMAGQLLFEAACEITLAGMRDQFPGKSEQEYLDMLRQRLAARRKWEREEEQHDGE